jgi:ring-1,2-phenylacetyl-CoA epoxidase subunit PaaC
MLSSEAARALRAYLQAMADDELILGHRHSEWTGLGPDVESDVALSSIAQEELGHARLFYLHGLTLEGRGEDDLDASVFDRPPGGFRNAVLLERPNGDWGFTIVRLVLYELADAVRLDVLARAPLELAVLVRALQREEKYHRMYGETWLNRLARSTPESQARVQAAVDAAWPEAFGLFEPTAGESHLLTAGLLPEPAGQQQERWRQAAAEVLLSLGLRPAEGAARGGGRMGQHSPDLAALLDEMTLVRRDDPGAKW